MTYFVRLDLQQSLRPYWQAGKYRGDTSGIWGLNEKKKKGIITAEPTDYGEIAGGREISLSAGPTFRVLKQAERKAAFVI